MSPEQMRARSAEKVKQMMELAKLLQLKVEARERVDDQGFITKVVFWVDNEDYPVAESSGPTGDAIQEIVEKVEAEVVEPAPEAPADDV